LFVGRYIGVSDHTQTNNKKQDIILEKDFNVNKLLSIDDIKIKSSIKYSNAKGNKTYSMPNIYEPVTGIINPATVIQKVNNLDDITNSLNEERPATLLMNINDSLEVIDNQGNVIKPISEVLEDIKGKMIPAFNVDSTTLGDGLTEFLRDESVKDFFLFSEKETVIKSARLIYSYTKGVLDLSNLEKEKLTKEDLIEIRDKTNKSQSTAVILPLKLLDYDNVRYLQQRLITVWTITDNQKANIYESILTGVNGIITDDFQGIFNEYSTFPENSLIRKPFIINHRGLSSYDEKEIPVGKKEPENSIFGVRQSIERGAEIIEIDLHITKDNHVVVFHDFDTSRLFNQKLEIAHSNLTDLQALEYKYTQFPDMRIETFADFMDHFKDDDVVFFIEIKSWLSGTTLVNQMREILEEKKMLDRAVVISFVPHQIEDVKTHLPELSVGYLSYDGLYLPDINNSVEGILDLVTKYPTTINHSYPGLTREHVKALSHRGITVWPWTINGEALDDYFLMGTGGNTTDTMQYYEDTWLGFDMEETEFIYDINNPSQFRINSHQYTNAGATYDRVPDYEIVDDGDTEIVLDRGQVVSAKNEGTVKIMVWMDTSLPNGTEIRLYRGIVTIEVIKTESNIHTGEIIDNKPKSNLKTPIIIGSIGGTIVLFAGIAFVVAMLIKKRKNK
jgi:glycerophosphoryl diester phosphodiesterase